MGHQWKTPKQLLACLVVAFAFPLAGTDHAAAEENRQVPAHVGSEACAACHFGESRAWDGSDHALAWTLPSEATIKADFADSVFEHDGAAYRFHQEGDGYAVQIAEPGAAPQDYEVVGVAGIAPLQQYLLETAEGRLQALDVAWDVGAARWYHLYPESDLRPGDGLHWTGPYKTWNARCAECHATGFRKNYDPRRRRYRSIQAEIGVGCEACHGPGEAHLAWARSPETYDRAKWDGLTDKGFTLGFAAADPEAEIQLCAGCHSRREPFTDGNPLPGTPYHDSYRLALLREGLYHADGSIDDEVYVYGSFLQSRMYARGVRCSDCHDPHRAQLKAEGNAVCTQCHAPGGNADFPSLRKAAYDTPEHHFHAAGTAGAQCKSCHMIERIYMGIDGRRDHAFRIPRPDLTAATGAPNACSDCHSDRPASWAAAEIARRFPDSVRRGPHYTQVFAAARRDPSGQKRALLELARRSDLPAIVRASALDLLMPVADAAVATEAGALLAESQPLVRAAAAGLQRAAPPAERARRLAPLLRDPLRAVRTAAAREFLTVPRGAVPAEAAADLAAAMQEWQASLLAKADYPESHMVIAGVALTTRNFRTALGAFHEAVRLDPQMVQAWGMIVRLQAASGDQAGARLALSEALAANPDNARLLELAAQLGLQRLP